MVLALVRKELREIWAIAALGLVVFCLYVTRLMDQGGSLLRSLTSPLYGINDVRVDVPFVADSFGSMLLTIGAALAIALGFRQSAWEPHQGTALYLLHLPLSRRAIFLTKLLTGIGLLLACTLFPILVYALWASTPGTHAGPFEWSMTDSAFRTWLILPWFYLGAFASGIRPARWFGSRLLPLAAVPMPALLCYAGAWWLVSLPLLCLVTTVLILSILWIAGTRDY